MPTATSPKTPKRRRLSAEEAKERILTAAQQRLEDGGPDSIRLQELAKDLGIAHPTILHHFGSRDGLIEALEDRAMRRLQADLLDPSRAGEDTLEMVYRTLGDQGHARLLVWMALSKPNLAEGDSDERMLETLAEALRKEREHAGFPSNDRDDSVFAVRLVATAMIGEALLGPLFSRSAGRAEDTELPRRFRAWLGRLLDAPRVPGPS